MSRTTFSSKPIHSQQKTNKQTKNKNQTLKSVIRDIKPDLVFPGDQSQNISVSGLAIDDVNHWLANIPRNREVRRVVIHIGVNTCRFAVITESMWKQLIRKLKHVFPEAAVLVSSIVPPMGRLQVSNAVFLAVCNREKVWAVDRTDAFTGAVHRGDTCTGTTCILVTVIRAAWCSTFSMLLAPAVARLATTTQAVALNRNKTRHSPSRDRKESSNTMQPDLRCWEPEPPCFNP